jgi:hypothetical protein
MLFYLQLLETGRQLRDYLLFASATLSVTKDQA